MQMSDWWRKFSAKYTQKSLTFLAAAWSVASSAQDQVQQAVEQAPAFGEQKWKFFDITWNGPMDTISGMTEWSRDINSVYLTTTVICTFVFFAVSIPLILTLVKFRRRSGDTTPPKQFHGNATLEVLWTAVPVVLLLFIAVPTWRVLFKHAQVPAGAMTVEVIGHQWWWEFRYPENGNIITANELHLPENTPVNFKIQAVDVLHSFWIPKFGGKKDAVPGHPNEMNLVTPPLSKPGLKGGEMFQGQCVELCGASHALMRFNVVLHTREEFNSWTKVAYTPPKVETAMQTAGAEVFARCQACHTIAGTTSEQIPGDKLGPNLTNFGNRKYLGAGTRMNTQENLAEWLHNPALVKPGALMPALGLTDEEIAQVGAFIRHSTVKTF